MEIDREPSENDLRSEMLMKVSLLIDDIVLVSHRSTEVRETNCFLQLF